MGGVDLADMLIEFCRTIIIKKRWYLKLIFNAAGLAKVNTWLFYHRQCLQLQVPKKHQLSLHTFIVDIPTSLNLKEKDPQKASGRTTKQSYQGCCKA